ncbi:MAG: NADH-quinone oxidoreductase subunit N [Verrucomicrobiota bacterium]
MTVLFDAPEIWLTVLACVLLLGEAFTGVRSRTIGQFAVVGTAVIFVVTLLSVVPPGGATYWSGSYIWDGTAQFFKLFFIFTSLVVTWMSLTFESQIDENRAEFYVLPLLITAGMCLLASAGDFMLMFVALELVTITFYILVAYQRQVRASLEAGVKYLILGGLSSAFLVMGIAYVYGLTGSTNFSLVFGVIQAGEITGPSVLPLAFGLLLVLVGIGFKIAGVPFHIWAPDVYQGAPTPITAFLSVGSKAAGFVILIRVLVDAFGLVQLYANYWSLLLIIMAAASMLLGNLAAIPQRNLKRMLAYSSIGHSGFVLIGVLALAGSGPARELGGTAVGIYLISYLIASLLAFVIVAIVTQKESPDAIHNYAGLWQRSPLLAGGLAVALISLAGIPPTVGFVGKLTIFTAAWEANLYSLFWIGVAAAVAGFYYYLGVVKTMFWSKPLDTEPIPVAPSLRFLILLLVVATFVLGFFTTGLQVMVGDLVAANL